MAGQATTSHTIKGPFGFYEEPLPDGPAKGAVLSREKVHNLIEEYYEAIGWHKKIKLPTKQKLSKRGLTNVTDKLQDISDR